MTGNPPQERRRIAVVLFNLGGPDGQDAVEPFLFNLFSDPAIIRVPGVVRRLIARLISSRRGPMARANYALMGGGSPILPETTAQAEALEAQLGTLGEVRVFIAMRYWHPMSAETARAVKSFGPDRIVLLPLYPQFSTTTSGSSLLEWRRAAKAEGLSSIPEATVCCYPRNAGFAADHADRIARALKGAPGPVRVLFSAHGLPESIVKAGDPYQWQIEATVDTVVKRVREQMGGSDFDWRICYQSRVGPMKWLQPSTDGEIRGAGAEGMGLVVTPIAFVSEHVETLVELDIEYGKLARESGVPSYIRVPALGISDGFIGGLKAAVERALARAGGGVASDEGGRICPAGFAGCPAAE
jgi:protoporphyrin/coproporphyrin ferrochelatase